MSFEDFYAKCKRVAEQLVKEKRLTVVGHYDADGLASTAILVKALRRAGVETDFINTRQIDSDHISEVNGFDHPIVFVDMGSGQIELLEKEIKGKFYIVDHHPPVKETPNQVNPFQHGIDGTRELSATGVAYFVARAMGEDNKDLSPVGVIGAVGDMQDLHGGLKGANRRIIKDAEELGLLNAHKNLTLFGRQSRPLPKMLEYCSEPRLPGLTGNYMACVNFIEQLGIGVRDPQTGKPRHYVELSQDERKKLTSALYMLLLDHNAPHLVTDMLIGEIYEFPEEKPKTELRDAKEFATVLNACVAPETRIMAVDGTIQTIDDMRGYTYSFSGENGSMTVDSHEGIHKVKLPKTLHMFEITMSMGLTVSATENHRFLAAGPKGVAWKPAEEISGEDYLAVPREIETKCSHYYYKTTDLFSSEETMQKKGAFRLRKCMKSIRDATIDEDFFELAGFILGDGHLSNNAVNLAFGTDSRSKELELHYKGLIRRLFALNNYTTDAKNGTRNIIWNNTTLSRVFQKLGILSGNKTKKIKIPQKLLMGPDSYVAALLRGLMESDGNVYRGGLEFNTHSKELAEQLPLLLLRFGIKSHLMRKKCRDCAGSKYCLIICGYDNVRRYNHSIGFVSSERKAWIKNWLKTKKKRNSNTDLIPFANEELAYLHRNLGLPNKWSSHFTCYKKGTLVKRTNLAKYLRHFASRVRECEDALEKGDIKEILDTLRISMANFAKCAGISREWLAKILNGKPPGKNARMKIQKGISKQKERMEEVSEHLKHLTVLTNSDLQWDKVKSVDMPERPEYVYDLTMHKNHNYFANGILVHNCGRHEEGEVGVSVCMGDRKEAWPKAKRLLEKHRRELRQGLEWVKCNGIRDMDNIHYFDASGVIRETLVGVIAGMVYGSMNVDIRKPIIAFGLTDEGEMKISARGNYDLVRAGLKLGDALSEATKPLGGEGGGHDVAAGAKIPPDKKFEFLNRMDEIVGKQLGS